MAGPLKHVKVLDLSRVLAGPWAGQILADLGADVLKVERPVHGDDTRSWGPPFLPNPDGKGRDAGYFLAANRGKRSITVDITTEAGQEIIRRLAAESDIVLENYRLGALKRYGLDYDSLKAVNPRLIYCSITGFGQTGPKADLPAYDFMIQAMGGLMSVTGEADGQPGGGPQKVGVPIVDLMTGVYAALAVLAALARREQDGQGDYIDVSMLDVMVGSLANQATNYLMSGKVPVRAGNKHPNIQPQDVFRCRDGHLVLVVGNDGQFRKFAEVLGHPEWADDPVYATNGARVTNRDQLLAQTNAILETKDRQEWERAFTEAGVPCSAINTVADALNDEQIRSRGLVKDIQHPVAGAIKLVGSPLKFAEAVLDNQIAPPTLGQHTREILTTLGYSQEEIAALNAQGAI